ncbi:hypothetical protein JHK82_043309 [Glycine max]|nr:hypothetical protein JHK82_043309 [Glycine max]
MDNHEHANHRDTAQARIKNKGIRQHKVNDQAQNIDCCVSVSSPENQNYMSSANDPAINREDMYTNRVTVVLIDEDNDQTENGGTHNDEIKEYLDCSLMIELFKIWSCLKLKNCCKQIKDLRDYPSMPYPEDANCPAYLDNSLILAELNYNNEELRSEFEHLFSHMTAIKIPLHLPPPPQSFILIILPIHVQSLNGTFNAPQFPNHLTCRHLHPPKSNDPSITHYFTSSDHGSFLYHLHFNSNQIILSKRLPPCLRFITASSKDRHIEQFCLNPSLSHSTFFPVAKP